MKSRSWVVVILIAAGIFAAISFFRTNEKQATFIESSKESAPPALEPPALPAPAKTIQLQETESSSQKQINQMKPRKFVPPRQVSSSVVTDLRNIRTESLALLEDSPWVLWVGVTAVKKTDNKSSAKVVAEINGYDIIESAGAVDLKSFSSEQPLVVVNSRLEIPGVVTGVVSVTLRKGASEDVIRQLPGVKILNSFPEIRTYFVTSAEEPFDLAAFRDFIKSQPDVEQSHLEILSRRYEKN